MHGSLSIAEQQAQSHTVTEWFDWAGGPCPVDKNAMVQVQCRFETFRDESQLTRRAASWVWSHDLTDPTFDIIAYRVVSA